MLQEQGKAREGSDMKLDGNKGLEGVRTWLIWTGEQREGRAGHESVPGVFELSRRSPRSLGDLGG